MRKEVVCLDDLDDVGRMRPYLTLVIRAHLSRVTAKLPFCDVQQNFLNPGRSCDMLPSTHFVQVTAPIIGIYLLQQKVTISTSKQNLPLTLNSKRSTDGTAWMIMWWVESFCHFFCCTSHSGATSEGVKTFPRIIIIETGQLCGCRTDHVGEPSAIALTAGRHTILR